jgi:hypothetical protein
MVIDQLSRSLHKPELMSAVGKMATIRKRACALPKILTQLGFEVV